MISPHIKAEKQTLASLLGFSCHSFAPPSRLKVIIIIITIIIIIIIIIKYLYSAYTFQC